MRNPVYRANSYFELQKRWGRVKKDIKINVKAQGRILPAANYIQNIKHSVLPFIPIENIYFCIMEWAKKDFIDSISKIQKFIGAEPYIAKVESHIIEKKVNNENPYISFFKENSNYHIWSQSYFEETPDDQIEKLYKYYEKSNEELFDFLGYDIPEWRI